MTDQGKNSANRALSEAVKKGDLQSAKEAVRKGANLNSDHYGDSLVCQAAQAGHLAVVKWLVEQGINPHAVNKESGTTVVDEARWYKQKEVVAWLKQIGVVSAREPGRKLSQALAREFGGKSVEHSPQKKRRRHASTRRNPRGRSRRQKSRTQKQSRGQTRLGPIRCHT